MCNHIVIGPVTIVTKYISSSCISYSAIGGDHLDEVSNKNLYIPCHHICGNSVDVPLHGSFNTTWKQKAFTERCHRNVRIALLRLSHDMN